MIEIVTIKGDKYSFDPETLRIFKGGEFLSKTDAEPVFMDAADGSPVFSGIYLKKTNQIVSRSGKVNGVDNADTL